jgi:drug/metabolite transporter (DMT)-like permease
VDRRAWSLMWMLALTWGASYLFIKVGLRSFEGIFLVWARLVCAAIVLVPLAAREGALDGLRARWRALAVLAGMQVAVPFVLITYGENHIPSALAGILVASAPIFTAMLVSAGLGPGEARIERWSVAGLLIGIVGVGLLFGVDLSGSAESALGGLMVVVAALGYALGALYLRRHFLGVPPVGVAAGSMVASSVLTLPFALFALPASAPAVNSLLCVLALGLVGTGFAFLLFYTLIAEVGAAKASLVTYLAPGFALIYGAVFLSESITVGAIGGLALILAGSWVAANGRAPWQRRAVVAV